MAVPHSGQYLLLGLGCVDGNHFSHLNSGFSYSVLIAMSYGIHPLHFGIMFIVFNLELGYLTTHWASIYRICPPTVFNRPRVDDERNSPSFFHAVLFDCYYLFSLAVSILLGRKCHLDIYDTAITYIE